MKRAGVGVRIYLWSSLYEKVLGVQIDVSGLLIVAAQNQMHSYAASTEVEYLG